MTENTEKEQKPEHWFKPGQSGNPGGKPRGRATKRRLQWRHCSRAKARRHTEGDRTRKDRRLTALRLCLPGAAVPGPSSALACPG